MSILYNLRRITEMCREHTESNFSPLPPEYLEEFELIRTRVSVLFNDSIEMMETGEAETVNLLRRHGEEIKLMISDCYHRLYKNLREDSSSSMTTLYVYLNLLQETREMVSALRKYLRSYAKMRDNDYSGRPVPALALN